MDTAFGRDHVSLQSAAMDTVLGSDHASLPPRCGICGWSMEVAQRFVLLIGNPLSTAFSDCLGPYIFPAYGHRVQHETGAVTLCREPRCIQCAAEDEASVAHSDCYDFVSKRCNLLESMDRFWVISTWRNAWREAPNFHLQQTAVDHDWSVFDRCGLSQMKRLSPETLQRIYKYSATSAIWRFNAAAQLVKRLSATSSDKLDQHLTFPLSEVAAWTRGHRPMVVRDTSHQHSVLRMTIDSWGIQRIERLPNRPAFKRSRTDSHVFIVRDQASLTGIDAHFKFGAMRLELPETRRGLETWDTPTPLSVQQCQFYTGTIPPATRLRTIDVGETHGMTFFFCHGEIYAIHAHTQTAPCAQSTFQGLSRRRQQSVTWVFVPISQEDSIDALGVQRSQSPDPSLSSTCMLFRMKLGGDIPVGLTPLEPSEGWILSKSPTTIVHNIFDMEPISHIGACPIPRAEEPPLAPFQVPVIEEPPLPNACFSLAPLTNVNRVSIFNSTQTGLCMGILLGYQNGAQRSVGQCRVGVDPVDDIVNPVRICFRGQAHVRPRTSVQLQGTVFKGTSRQEHDHAEPGWTCFGMQGFLKFWFTCEETQLTVIAGKQY